MKSILCGLCADIRGVRPDGITVCECGNVAAWWVDPRRGTLKVHAKDRDEVRVIGMHNGFLGATWADEPKRTHAAWKTTHDYITARASDGYIFHENQRGCWACIVRVGDTSDITWADDRTGPVDESSTDES